MTSDASLSLSDGSPSTAGAPVFSELIRMVERMHRRFLDLVRVEVGRLGADDISPTQAVMLMALGRDELSVRGLVERGYYLGSNASYNLKHLIEAGYVDRTTSQRDRRVARLRLSAKGIGLVDHLRRWEEDQAESLASDGTSPRDLEQTYRTLRRVERTWTDLMRYAVHDLD